MLPTSSYKTPYVQGEENELIQLYLCATML